MKLRAIAVAAAIPLALLAAPVASAAPIPTSPAKSDIWHVPVCFGPHCTDPAYTAGTALWIIIGSIWCPWGCYSPVK